jgi:hypothetical protein
MAWNTKNKTVSVKLEKQNFGPIPPQELSELTTDVINLKTLIFTKHQKQSNRSSRVALTGLTWHSPMVCIQSSQIWISQNKETRIT